MKLITRLERAARRITPTARPLLILTLEGGQYELDGQPLDAVAVDELGATHELIIVHYIDHWPPAG